jgi:endonuclease/exonuclease/phosphatase family metal-dependent hydrolase
MTRARSKSKRGLVKKWVLGINLFFILILLLTYITPYVKVETWGWLSLLALAYPFILMINGIFAITWLVTGHWYAVFSLATILIGFGHHMRYVKLFSIPDQQADCKESIQVMSYNMRGLAMIPVPKGEGIQARINKLYEALTELEEMPDIMCLQEAAKGDMIATKFGLKHSIRAPKSSLWLLSKYPIIDHGQLEGLENNPSVLWADLKTPSGTLRVYNMHLVSNRVTNTAEELIQDMDFQNENTWSNIKFIVSRYRRTTQKRSTEAIALREHMEKCKYPMLIAGDGNDTPLSNTYHILADGLKDSFKQRGFGLSTTYESKLPLLRIDYFFGSKDIYFKDHRTHHLSYSDHYPISTGICISRTSS